jgi:uncharacterized integral membrane protein (TIGR00697 family)
MFYGSMQTPPADFWITSKSDAGIANMQAAFSGIFGQGMWIIAGSLVAFLVSQIVDVTIFHRIKRITGDKKVWLRATGSTVVSQFIDSYIVLAIAFKLGSNWSWPQIFAVGTMNYLYKFTMAILLTPVIYLAEQRIVKYLGFETASKMKLVAMGKESD